MPWCPCQHREGPPACIPVCSHKSYLQRHVGQKGMFQGVLQQCCDRQKQTFVISITTALLECQKVSPA